MAKDKTSSTDEQKTSKKSIPAKPKPKKKARASKLNRPTTLAVVVLISSLGLGLVLNRCLNFTHYLPGPIQVRLMQLLGNDKQYHFKETPVQSFDISRGVDRKSNLSLAEFKQLYDGKWPVLITDAMKDWAAMKKWNKRFFMLNYGQMIASFKGVMGSADTKEGMAAPIGLFLEHIDESSPNSWTYIDDEVFLVRNPGLKKDIGTPIYLEEDFFSLLPEDIRPWNAMLLWGTKFSRSSLHIDPYNWTGTNAVLSGRKLWKMYPPGQDHLLYVPENRQSGFPLNCPKYNSRVDAFDYDPKKYPLMKQAQALEFEQLPGEMLIIPTGWFHQAYNDEETLAISSQVMNSQNYRQVLEEIIKGKNVKTEDIPSNLDLLSPKSQVELIISLFPKSILEQGRKVNNEIMDQLDGAQEKASSAQHP